LRQMMLKNSLVSNISPMIVQAFKLVSSS
jgi:hypothetical protein